jgi:hypothetical protein
MYTTEEYGYLNTHDWEDVYNEDGWLVDVKAVPAPKPVDGCSWYRKGFLLLLLTTLLVVGGLAVSAIAVYLVVNFLAFLLGGFVVFSWVDVGAAAFVLFVSAVVSFFLFISTLIATMEGVKPLFPKYMSKYFPKKSEDKEKEKYWRKKAKQPSAVVQYYKAWKEAYCPVLVLEKDE